MRHARRVRLASRGGFTLIETVIVLMVLGVAAVAIVTLQGNIFKGAAETKSTQVSIQLLQECAEKILGTRRNLGFAAAQLQSDICANVTSAGFGAPTVTITSGSNTSLANGGGTALIPACPTATKDSCKLVTIQAPSGLTTPVTLLFASYGT